MRSTGYLEHAAARNIIMLFPQSGDVSTANRKYCWKSDKSHKSEPQILAIANIIKAIFNKDILFEGLDNSSTSINDTNQKNDANNISETIF